MLAAGVPLHLSARSSRVSLARQGLAPHRKPPNVLNRCLCSGLPSPTGHQPGHGPPVAPSLEGPPTCLQGRRVGSNRPHRAEAGSVLLRAPLSVPPPPGMWLPTSQMCPHIRGRGPGSVTAQPCDLRQGPLSLGLIFSVCTKKGSGWGEFLSLEGNSVPYTLRCT